MRMSIQWATSSDQGAIYNLPVEPLLYSDFIAIRQMAPRASLIRLLSEPSATQDAVQYPQSTKRIEAVHQAVPCSGICFSAGRELPIERTNPTNPTYGTIGRMYD